MSGIRDRRATSGAPRTYRASLRFPLAVPLLIALLTLVVLWGYAASGMTGDALRQRAEADRVGATGDVLHPLVSALQEERLRTAAWQSAADDTSRAELDSARTHTDETVEAFHAARADVSAAGDAAADQVSELAGTLNELATLRDTVDASDAAEIEAYTGYTDTVTEGTALLAVAGRVDSAVTARGSAAVTELVRLGEGVARGETLLHLAEVDGADGAAAERFATALAAQREAHAALDAGALPADEAAAYTRLTESEEWEALTAVEAADGQDSDALPEAPAAWADAARGVGERLDGLTADGLDSVTARGTAEANRALLVVAVGTLVALGGLAAAVVLGRRAWRSLSDRMAELERDTRELTEQRLPELTEQLQRSKPEIPDLPPERDHTGDELDRVAAATEYQWRRLVETLISQARGRAGTETVLLGLARRTQSLINRMIPKLDKLEREHQDSRLLKDIFVVDHLATRMRRHTENLLILGGSLPARRWGKPVPVYEVVRSAISETEDYSRVEAMPGPTVSLTGRAVADVSHLLAELIENGASFSPPETKVTVSAETVAKGRLAIEVVDRGLGMPPAEYDRLNLLLSDPPRLDIAELGTSPRLGLLVVARLAKRHGLEVVLRRSPYGGTLAVVLLPNELLEQSKPLLPDVMARGARPDADPRDSAALPGPAPEHPGAASPGVPPWGAPAGPAPEAPAMPVRGAPAMPMREAPVPPAREAQAEPARQAPAAAMRAALGGGAPLAWVGDDGSGYPAYSGAGLLPPDAGGSPAAGRDQGPRRFPVAGPEPTPDLPAPDLPVPEASLPSLAPLDGLPMGPGGGLLPPDDTQAPGRDRAEAPGRGHADGFGTPWAPALSETTSASTRALAAPEPPDQPNAQTPPDSPETPTGPDIAYTREVSVPPHAEEARTAPDDADPTAGRDASGTASPEPTLGGDTPLALPVRVRGENLAEGLRAEQPSLASAGKGLTDAAPSPERAARTVGAIQWGNRRARAAAEAHDAAQGHDQAADPGHPTGSDEPARKDQQ